MDEMTDLARDSLQVVASWMANPLFMVISVSVALVVVGLTLFFDHD